MRINFFEATKQTACIFSNGDETGFNYYGARYLDPKYSRWMSGDPALGEYIPKAPIDDEAKKHNENLPGMGGVYNVVNLHLYHYAGNNPVKYIDPDGRMDFDVWYEGPSVLGVQIHTAIEAKLTACFDGVAELGVSSNFFDGRVDYANTNAEKGVFGFYEIKPITQNGKNWGELQLANYVDQYNANPANSLTAIQGTSLLEEINGITLHDVPLYVVGLHLKADIRLITFSNNSLKAGMIYYDMRNSRIDREYYKEAAEGALTGLLFIGAAAALSFGLSPEALAIQ